jgi:alpha-glucoside transport system permease protein
MSARVPNIMKQGNFVPWLYLAPTLLIMSVYVIYPIFVTGYISLRNADSSNWAHTACRAEQPCWGILENYRYALSSELNMENAGTIWQSFWLSSFGNNVKWIFFMVVFSVGIGLLMAVLADRVKYESVAKSIIFVPMAISFVGAGVIWKFVYNFGTTQTQIGILNAILRRIGGEPIAFMQNIPLNTFMLIVVGVWMWAGFCMVILSAAIKGVPEELLEAARMEGANEITVFTQITVPIIYPTIIVVITTMVINTLKIFDIVFVMTGGNFSTDVIANRMYTEMYINQQAGRGTAVAILLILAVLPFIYINIKRFQEQEMTR